MRALPAATRKRAHPVIKANLERVFHLDEPLWRQYYYLQTCCRAILARVIICRITVADLFARAFRFHCNSVPWLLFWR
jgi:hypothetical protein